MTTSVGVFDAFAWAPLGLWNCRREAPRKANNAAQEATIAADDILHTLRNRSRNPASIAAQRPSIHGEIRWAQRLPECRRPLHRRGDPVPQAAGPNSLLALLCSAWMACAQPAADHATGPGSPTPPQQQSVGGPGADSQPPNLPCTPCETSADCGGPDDLCIINSVNGASFCTTACASPLDCPKAFLCVAVQGAPSKQCIPQSGSCDGYDPKPPDPGPEPAPGGTPAPSDPDPATPAPGPEPEPGPAPDPGTGGGSSGSPPPLCYGLCVVGIYNDCTCHPSDPCGWSADGYCDDVCAQVLPGATFDDTADCGAAPAPGGDPAPGGPPSDCGSSCNDGVYDTCTCAASDPCGWAADGYCDDTCYQLSLTSHFDDGPDCGGNPGPGPAPGGDTPTPPPAGADSFAVTSVQDGLDDYDATLMASGLEALGYARFVRDTNVTTGHLSSYLSQELTVLYHTGHGNEGSVVTADGWLGPGATSIRTRHSIFATCLTLQQSWAAAFGPTAETVMGYTDISFDGLDDNVAEAFLAKLGAQKTYLQAWYLANASVGMLSDRWAAYVRQNGSIVEYSARSGQTPMASGAQPGWTDFGGALLVDDALLQNRASFEPWFSRGARADAASTPVEQVDADIATVPTSHLSATDAVAAAEQWLLARGGPPPDAQLESITEVRRGPPGAAIDLVGYLVRYTRSFHGLPIAANGIDHHVALLVGDAGVLSDSRVWPSLRNARRTSLRPRPMHIGQALRRAAPKLARMLKGRVLHVVQALPVLATHSASAQADLEPAYELHTLEGARIVISALTGRPVR